MIKSCPSFASACPFTFLALACITLSFAAALPARDFVVPLAQTDVDGAKLGIKAGDTLLLEPGERSYLRIEKVVGTADSYVTIRAQGGEVLIRNTDRYYDIFVGTSHFFRITGTGVANIKYGIHLAGTNVHGSGLIIAGLSSDCEVDHLQIEKPGFAGMLVKTDGAVGAVMDNISLHHNYIHDTGGEGMYVGETKIPGQHFHHLEIWNNIVARSGYEACQICNIVEDCKIHNNVFYHAGLRRDLWQDRNMQIAHSTCDFRDNLVIQAHSTILVGSGGGPKLITNNYFEGTLSGPGVEFGDAKLPGSSDSSIAIEANFFRDISSVQPIIIFTGSETTLHASGNVWEGENAFIQIQPIIDLSKKVIVENNRNGPVARPRFVDEKNDNFLLVDGDPYRRLGLGIKPE